MVTVTKSKQTSTECQSERLMQARCRLLTREPFYGHVAMSMRWIPSQMPWMPEWKRTMGVRIVNGCDIECIFYPPFVERLSIKELFAVIQHEIEHIVRCHCIRIGGRQHEPWNIACDLTVNGSKSAPRIGYHDPSTNKMIVPMEGDICWIPEDWNKDGTAEQFYEKLEKAQQNMGKCCPRCGRPQHSGKKKKEEEGKGKDGKNKGKDGQDGKNGGGKGKDKDDKGQGQGQGQGQGEGEGDEGEGQGEGQGQGQGQGSGGQGQGGDTCDDTCPSCGQSGGRYEYGGISGKSIDDHSVWNQSDVSQDEARQIIKDVVDQAAQKCQGNVPGHLAEAIRALATPVVRWRELLRHYLGKHVGSQRRTYSRRDRRHDAFGMPGISHHAAATVNVIVDTSGSVGSKELEQFFGEIEMISHKCKTNLLQWDHAFQGWCQYKRGGWKKIKVHGRGGTDMSAPIQWLIDNKMVADVQVLLSDGYANWHAPCPFPMITVLTTGEDATKGPDWGHTVRMKMGQ